MSVSTGECRRGQANVPRVPIGQHADPNQTGPSRCRPRPVRMWSRSGHPCASPPARLRALRWGAGPLAATYLRAVSRAGHVLSHFEYCTSRASILAVLPVLPEAAEQHSATEPRSSDPASLSGPQLRRLANRRQYHGCERRHQSALSSADDRDRFRVAPRHDYCTDDTERRLPDFSLLLR